MTPPIEAHSAHATIKVDSLRAVRARTHKPGTWELSVVVELVHQGDAPLEVEARDLVLASDAGGLSMEALEINTPQRARGKSLTPMRDRKVFAGRPLKTLTLEPRVAQFVTVNFEPVAFLYESNGDNATFAVPATVTLVWETGIQGEQEACASLLGETVRTALVDPGDVDGPRLEKTSSFLSAGLSIEAGMTFYGQGHASTTMGFGASEGFLLGSWGLGVDGRLYFGHEEVPALPGGNTWGWSIGAYGEHHIDAGSWVLTPRVGYGLREDTHGAFKVTAEGDYAYAALYFGRREVPEAPFVLAQPRSPAPFFIRITTDLGLAASNPHFSRATGIHIGASWFGFL